MPVEVYSTDTDSGVISVVTPVNGSFESVAQIPIGNAPRGAVKFTKDGRGFVSNCGGDTVSEIDVLTHRETARIKVGPAPRGLGVVPGDRYALVSNSGANTISIVDLGSRQEVRQVATGRDPRHMAISADGRHAYVAVWGSHYVAKLDLTGLAEGRPEEVREVARIPVGHDRHPYSVALHPARKELYVASTRSKLLSIIDTTKGAVEAEIDLESVGARAVAFSKDGGTAFVTIENTSEVVFVDTVRRKVVNRIPVGPGPRGLALEPLSNTLYVSAFARTGASGGLASVRPENTLTVVNLAPVGRSLATAGAEKKVRYDFAPVAQGSCSVAVLDTDGLSVEVR
ncbi:MAG TPA: beta-propeller fold lactonase family protein [Longimicrobium sp.]